MNIDTYIQQYFKRFPKKKYMIMKGNLENIKMDNSKKIVLKTPYDFKDKPIHTTNLIKNNYILISRMNKKDLFYVEMLYNLKNENKKSDINELVLVINNALENNIGIQDIYNIILNNPNLILTLNELLNDPNLLINTASSLISPENISEINEIINQLGIQINDINLDDIQNIIDEQVKPTSDEEVKPISNEEVKPISNEKKVELGLGYLNKNNMNIYLNNNQHEEIKISINDKKIKYMKNNNNILQFGNLEVISYILFQKETNIKLDNIEKPNNEMNEIKPDNNYEKINLYFTFYETMNPKTYGTHYCLEENAIEWKINKGPDFGSYAFSIPPFPECSQNTPASFIFALSENEYNKLKEGNKKNINVYTTVKYKNNDKIVEKNIEFILYLKK